MKMKLDNTKIVTLLLIFALFGSINHMALYLEWGPRLRGGDVGDDDSKITLTANDIINNHKIDTGDTNGIPNSWLAMTHYPPGYMILLAVVSQVSDLELPLPIPALSFLFVVWMLLFAYTSAFYFTENRVIALITSFLFVIVRMVYPFMGVQWMVGRTLAFVFVPFFIYLFHKAIFFDKKYVIPSILASSSLLLTHRSTSFFIFFSILFFFIILIILFRLKNIRYLFTLFVILLLSYIMILIYYGINNRFSKVFVRIFSKSISVVYTALISKPLLVILTLLITFLLIFIYHKIKKKVLRLKLFFKKRENLFFVFGGVLLILYFLWVFYKFDYSFYFGEVFKTLFTRKDFNYYGILNLGVGIIGFVPLGIMGLLKLKASVYKKLFVLTWFLLLTLNMFRFLNLLTDYHKVLLALVYPFILISSIGVYYFFRKNKNVILKLIVLFLMLSLSLTATMQGKLDDDTLIYYYSYRDTATRWINNNLKSKQTIIGDIDSVYGLELYSKQRPLNSHMFIDRFYKSIEVFGSLVSEKPESIVSVLRSSDTEYLILNKKLWINIIYNSHALFNKHPYFQYIYHQLTPVYGDSVKWGISDVGKELSKKFKKENSYKKINEIKNLNKVYSNGESWLYYLNSKKLIEPFHWNNKFTKKNHLMFIKNATILSNNYLSDDPINVSLEIENKLPSEIRTTISLSVYDEFSNLVLKHSTDLNLQGKSNSIYNEILYLSKYNWPGKYTFIIELLHKNQSFDTEAIVKTFEKYPINFMYSEPKKDRLIIDEHVRHISRIEEEPQEVRSIYLENILNHTINFSLTYNLTNPLKGYTSSKNYSLGPHGKTKVSYWIIPRRNIVFQQKYRIDSEYGTVLYEDVYKLYINLTYLSKKNYTGEHLIFKEPKFY
jgi:hypothetical protein